jgi:cytochrome P450
MNFRFFVGIVFRHQDHNARIIHKALVNHLADQHLDPIIQEQLKQIQFSENFDVRRTTFYFAVRLLTTLTCSSAVPLMNDKTFQLFEQNLYKISKAIHADTLERSAKVALTQLTGLSETLDINENVLDYIKTWIQYRRDQTNVIDEPNNEQTVTSITKNNDLLESIFNVIDESSPRLDDDDIVACVLDIIMHGSEMLKGALSWLLLYAVKYPEEADTCRREAR